MANHELMMAGNHNVSFRQEQFMEARQNSELFPSHDFSFALEPLHETNRQMGVSREQNEVWNHNQEHALTLRNSRTHSEEHCLEGKDEVDSQENQNESYDHAFDLSFPDNEDSETSGNDKLALAVSHSLNDNLKLGVGHCMNRDPIPGLDISLSQQAELAPPILQCRSMVTVSDHNLAVGMEFSDVLACRRALRDAAIALRFEMQTVKSDKTRFTAKCTSQGCPWRIHCAKLSGVPTFTIRTIHGSHTCGGVSHLGHHQASVQWVAEAVKERLKENPHCKPKEILEEIHQIHGITLSYKQAWRGKERIMAAVRGSFEEDYRLLPRYCDEIKRTNPGSIAVVHGSPVDGTFQQLFISFQASICGFLNACRPLIALDKTVLKSKSLGTLLLATGFDGDGAIFPLAFAIMGEDDDSNWQWFLSELRQLLEVNLENMPKLTILSNRDTLIVEGVDANFPTAFHGFCIHYLAECFHEKFNNSFLVNLFWEAAKCLTDVEFDAKIHEIVQISPEAALWIRTIPSSLWTTYCFNGKRFGHLTANVTETFNGWIQDASGLPIIQMLEYIRRQLMTLFNERRETSMQWDGMLVPSAERQVLEAIEESHAYQVYKANEAQFEILTSEGEKFQVDIRYRVCSCRGWELYGLPCSHAVAALLSCRQDVYRFTECYFTVANYRETYAETIHPVPDKTMWAKTEPGREGVEGGDEVVIRPPRLLGQQSRPRKRRSQGDDSGRQKRAVRCSRCSQTGHFRTTCTAPI